MSKHTIQQVDLDGFRDTNKTCDFHLRLPLSRLTVFVVAFHQGNFHSHPQLPMTSAIAIERLLRSTQGQDFSAHALDLRHLGTITALSCAPLRSPQGTLGTPWIGRF